MTEWCNTNCPENCPSSHCVCGADSSALRQCSPVGVWRAIPSMENWCNNNCNHNPPHCPKSHCVCE